MPHINIKAYPKNLTEQELQTFADELTTFMSKKLSTPKEYITISYAEIPVEEWKEKVFDAEIMPNLNTLLRKPHYNM